MNGEIVFTVKAAPAPFEVVSYTPTEAVESLETITITFSEEIEGKFETMAMDQIYLGNRNNGCSFEVNGNVLTITPFYAITTPGEYALKIPAGLITRKSNGEAVTMNGEIVFTVKAAPAPLEVVTVTPSEAVESLHVITIEFDSEIAVDSVNINACTIDYGWGVIIGTTASVEGKVLKLVSFSPISDKGQYPLTIPAGVVTRVSDGVAYKGGVFTFEVKEKEKEPLTVVMVTPESDVNVLDVITIEFNYNMSVNAMSTVVATIANADNSISYTFNTMDDIKYNGKVITFYLGENAITTAGEYTLTIPSGLISATDGTKYTGTHTFTVTVAEGIEGVETEVEQTIYDLTGRKIEKATKGGIYIIDGKKVLVK